MTHNGLHDLYGSIEVRGARENNLRNVSVDIPKRRITVFTGVSGSGKSSLVFGTIAAESQRLLNDTFSAFVQNFLPHYGQPDADSLNNLSAAIIVDQKRLGGNSRSTVGTITDTYSMLRLLYSRLGQPHIGGSSAFSFNDPQGMCPECEGLGQMASIDLDALVDRDKSLNEGAIQFPTFAVGQWYWQLFIDSGYFDPDKKLRDFTDEEWNKFLNMEETKIKVQIGGSKTMNMTFEGLLPKFRRSYLSKDFDSMQPHIRTALEPIVTRAECPACGGTRLNQAALGCLIHGKSIADCAAMEVSQLADFVRTITEPTVAPMVHALAAKLDNLVYIGLGYLSLNRETSTLSGGESQRVKMVRHLGSSLTDMTYVFDEPSIGLHMHDVHRLNELLVQLRNKGNTVLVVEHKPKVIRIADHVVDMGPGAGRYGGNVVYQGSYEGLLEADTVTGRHMSTHQAVNASPRTPKGWLTIKNASMHNLKNVSVDIPEGVMTVVTGVAGSGKSSLIRGYLPELYSVVSIDQTLTRGSKRSNLATYTGMLDVIRKRFATTNKVSPALFSANSKGACPECSGLGLIYTDLAFLDPVASTCEACGGKQFTEEVLAYHLDGKSISDVLSMSVVEAAEFFTDPVITRTLTALVDVGLSYLTLRQPLTTLSGGERQRLKLATELGNTSQIYILDEPTTGLHMQDVDNLIGLLNRLVDNGSTVIVIEHNLDVIARADWVIDLGPGAGHDGGRLVFSGVPADLIQHEESITGRYVREHHESALQAQA